MQHKQQQIHSLMLLYAQTLQMNYNKNITYVFVDCRWFFRRDENFSVIIFIHYLTPYVTNCMSVLKCTNYSGKTNEILSVIHANSKGYSFHQIVTLIAFYKILIFSFFYYKSFLPTTARKLKIACLS